jgi:anti-sigma factor RsiW
MNVHVLDRLDAYVDGELTAEEAMRLEDHLERCAVCAAHLADSRVLAELLRSAASVPSVESSARFWQRLAPTLPAHRSDLGAGWLWAAPMLVSGVVAYVVPFIAFAVALAAAAGYPLWHLAGEAVPPLAGAAGRLGPAMEALGRWTLWPGWADGLGRLPEPVVLYLPTLLFAFLAGMVSLVFMGWALASLRRVQVRPVPSL